MVDRAAVMQAVRRPASAAVAGIIFAVILGAVIVLLRNVVPEVPSDLGQWSEDPARREPSALRSTSCRSPGIAFLWFIAVIRAQVGATEDRFVGTVFLGSGLIFVALLFAAAAALKAVLTLQDVGDRAAAGEDGRSGGRSPPPCWAPSARAWPLSSSRRWRRRAGGQRCVPEVAGVQRLRCGRHHAAHPAAAVVHAVPVPRVGPPAEPVLPADGGGCPPGEDVGDVNR